MHAKFTVLGWLNYDIILYQENMYWFDLTDHKSKYYIVYKEKSAHCTLCSCKGGFTLIVRFNCDY